MNGKAYIVYIGVTIVLMVACGPREEAKKMDGRLKVSDNGRYFVKGDAPFFWLGDTGWLLFSKLTREEAGHYLQDRAAKGFNVIQVMVIHDVDDVNVYGDSALVNKNVSTPLVTEGSSPSDSMAYDFWDHVDYIIDQAASHNLYIALVAVWGSNVKSGKVTKDEASSFAAWLAERYKDKDNIIWVNGGDIKGEDGMEVWQTIGETINRVDTNHLITFHPRGRTQSSTWFHNAAWLDFNMFQSGHRRYDQDTSRSELRYGEDNWKYVQADYQKEPVKPTLDGEPSYEGIPQGLHDPKQPLWKDDQVRRYAYWSVFAGGAGFTYGDNSVMQMLKAGDEHPAYGATMLWTDALQDSGSFQMQYLKALMLNTDDYFSRVPDTTLVIDQGQRYNRIVSTREKDRVLVYTYTGRAFDLKMGVIGSATVKASWYDPRNGEETEIGEIQNSGTQHFDPPGEPEEGNDWVLLLKGT